MAEGPRYARPRPGPLPAFAHYRPEPDTLTIETADMALLRFSAWFAVHISVPVFAPIALLPILRLGITFRHTARGIVSKAVQDGQLFWVAITIGAENCYELAGYQNHATGAGGAVTWAALLLVVVGIIFSSALVLLGTIDSLDRGVPREAAGGSQMIVLVPCLTTAVVSMVFSATQFHAQT